jgi:hypothetical protein
MADQGSRGRHQIDRSIAIGHRANDNGGTDVRGIRRGLPKQALTTMGEVLDGAHGR